jgi:propionate CoA-transferase
LTKAASFSVLSSVEDGSVVAVSGFNMATTPEHLILKLFERYQKTGHPRGLFLICDALPAVPGRALDTVSERLFREGDRRFLEGVLIPFLGFSPWTQKLVEEEMLEAYSWPIGIVAYWFREVASGRPGLITKIGIDTLLDPRKEGGTLNRSAARALRCKVDVLRVEGEEYLFYHAPKPEYALVRASFADALGNLSMADEGIRGTVLNMAQATKARPDPGTVVAQVRRIARSERMNPREVDVPFPLVDHLVVSPARHHWQGGSFEYDPRVSYKVTPPLTGRRMTETLPPPERGYELVIARRVLLELMKVLGEKGSPVLVNLGIGIPALVSALAVEEGVAESIVTVLESGPWGGLALTGVDFGLAISPFALSSVPDMFSNFEGGVIDAASLGFMQVDASGDVNPSILPGRISGPGGFPVIAGGGPRTYFGGAFTAGRSRIRVGPNGLEIAEDGGVVKFVEKVYRTLFSGRESMKHGKEILYVTERAVFRLTKEGVVLEEIAPGVDLEKHVLRKMRFEPIVSPHLEQMDKVLFREEKMGIRRGAHFSRGRR